VGVGLGYSTNTGNRASLNYDDLAVFGLRLRSALTLETRRQTARADFYFPTRPDGYNDSIGTLFERTDLQGQTTTTASVAAKRAWGLPTLERAVTLELLTEQKTVDGLPPERSKSLPLTYNWTRRAVDNLLLPTRGQVINASHGGA
jgi:translocation and assembly module TamA